MHVCVLAIAFMKPWIETDFTIRWFWHMQAKTAIKLFAPLKALKCNIEQQTPVPKIFCILPLLIVFIWFCQFCIFVKELHRSDYTFQYWPVRDTYRLQCFCDFNWFTCKRLLVKPRVLCDSFKVKVDIAKHSKTGTVWLLHHMSFSQGPYPYHSPQTLLFHRLGAYYVICLPKTQCEWISAAKVKLLWWITCLRAGDQMVLH